MKGTNSPDLELRLPSLDKQINDLEKRLGCVHEALKADVSEIVVNGDLGVCWGSAERLRLLEFMLDFVNCWGGQLALLVTKHYPSTAPISWRYFSRASLSVWASQIKTRLRP